jgi:hypothetical protein
MKAPSITFSGPNGWHYSTRVEDTQDTREGEGRRQGRHHLTEALIVSIDDGK